jgi:uncharacterized protein YcbX
VHISALNVYPVKSCRGIALQSAELTATGFAYDREWMMVHPDGEFVTQRDLPRMALIATALTQHHLELAAPSMPVLQIALQGDAARTRHTVRVWRDHVAALDEGEAAARWLTTYLGTPLRLMRFAPDAKRACNPEFTREHEGWAKFADGYSLLIISEASLADLNRHLAAKSHLSLPMNRFRPNIVLAGDDVGPYDEDRMTWLHGEGYALKAVKPCIRCSITTTDQATAEVAVEPLLTLATYRVHPELGGPAFGQNAIVVEGAGHSLRTGAPVDIEWNF